MIHRRSFLFSASAALLPLRAGGAKPAALTGRERVNRVLAGKSPDRAPYTFWHHFQDEKLPGLKHAASTLDFARRFNLDLVKVMSDYPYPKGSSAQWYELKVTANPFPDQAKALELIGDGLAGQKHFVETQFNPWTVATKLSSEEAVVQLMREKPQALLDALEAIAKSEANHVRAAMEHGASGVFLAIDCAQPGALTREEYRKFSEPFDRMVLDAVKDAPLNTLHLHGAKVYLDLFWRGWRAPVINYSAHETGVSLTAARGKTGAVLMGGLDHRSVATAPKGEVKSMVRAAAAAAPRWICAPGCSVPDDSATPDLRSLAKTLATL